MINKILLTIVLVVAVWLGFKYWNRFVVLAAERRRREVPRAKRPPREPDPEPAAEVEDMVPCRACAAYVPARSARRCGRPDCPF